MRVRLEVVLVLAALSQLASCGFVSGGIAAASDSSSSSSSSQPVGSDVTLASDARLSPALIEFLLRDVEGKSVNVELFYERAGGPRVALNLVAKNGVDTDLDGLATSSTGRVHQKYWDFASQLGGSYGQDAITIVVAVSGLGAAGESRSAPIHVGNDPPEIAQSAALPGFAEAEVRQGEVTGLVDVTFVVADSSEDLVDVRVEYLVTGGPAGQWKPARPVGLAGGEPTPDPAIVDVNARPPVMGGTRVTFVWDVTEDLGTTDAEVQLRFGPDDRLVDDGGQPMGQGLVLPTPSFRVDNNEEPDLAVGNEGLFSSDNQRRGVPIGYEIADVEADDARLVLQWRRFGQDFDSAPLRLPEDRGALEAVLADPALRAQHQIADEVQRAYLGRVTALRSSLDPLGDEVVLPELGTTEIAAQREDLVGARLELMRRGGVPRPLPSSALVAPVAALSTSEPLEALVLDEVSAGSWNVERVDLGSGDVVASVVTGASLGTPVAMTRAQGSDDVFVLEQIDALTWQVQAVDPATGAAVVHATASDPAVQGTARGLASLGGSGLVVTVDDALVRIGPDAAGGMRLARVTSGLAAPHGVARHPEQPGVVLVAERDWVCPSTTMPEGRVASVDLASGTVVNVFPGQGACGAGSPLSPEALAVVPGTGRLRVTSLGDPFDGLSEIVDVGLLGTDTVTLGSVANATSIAVDPDGLLLCATSAGLLVSGGVEQVRTVTERGPTNTTRFRVDAPFDPPAAGQPFRLVPARTTVPARGFAVVDASSVPQAEDLFLRLTPYDTERGGGEDTIALSFARDYGASEEKLAEGLGVRGARIADLDGDGDGDVVYGTDAGLVVLRQHAGTFQPLPQGTFGGGDTGRPVVADVDGDGLQDVVGIAGEAQVHLQDTFGAFSLGDGDAAVGDVAADLGALPVAALVAADLNADGRMDLVGTTGDATPTTGGPGGQVAVAYQDALGAFATTVLVPQDFNASVRGSLDVLDLSSDGLLDVVFVENSAPGVFGNPGGATLWTLRQSTAGSFALEEGEIKNVSGYTALAVADLDLDGDEDLAVVLEDEQNFIFINHTTYNLGVALQDENGVLTMTTSLLDTELDFPGGLTLEVPDLDGDGVPDILFGGRDIAFQGALPATSYVALRSADTPLAHTQIDLGVESVVGPGAAFALGDLDGDGSDDLVLGGDLDLILGDRPGRLPLAEHQEYALGFVNKSADRLVLADQDGDGDTDLLVVGVFSDDGTLVLEQTSPGFFFPLEQGFFLPPTSDDVRFEDIDRDGLLDVLRGEAPFVQVWYGEGDGAFAATADQVTSSAGGSRRFSIGDMDADGLPELVVTDGRLVFVGQSLPRVFLERAVWTPTFSTSGGIELIDLGLDGLLDVLVPGGSNFLTVRRDPADPFDESLAQETQHTPTGSSQRDYGVADMDGDGFPDVIGVTPGTGASIVLFFSDEQGTLTEDLAASAFDLSAGLEEAVPVDMDLDGDLDVVVRSSDDFVVHEQVAYRRWVPRSAPRDVGEDTTTLDLAVEDLDGDGEPDVVLLVDRESSDAILPDKVRIWYGGW